MSFSSTWAPPLLITPIKETSASTAAPAGRLLDRCQAPSVAWKERSNQQRTEETPQREEPFSRRTPAGQPLTQPRRHAPMTTPSLERDREGNWRHFAHRSVLGTEPRIRPSRVSLRKLERRMVGRRWVFVRLPARENVLDGEKNLLATSSELIKRLQFISV